ncbi:hypothetical protein ACGYLF_01530 [Sulfitobacter sp. 1A10444]
MYNVDMATPYTTSLAVQNYLQQTLKASFSSQLTAYIEAMSEYCDELAGFPIYRTDETERKYDGCGLSTQQIDHVHTITEVTVSGAVVEPLQVPYNSDVKTELKLPAGVFTPGAANVSVTGIHCLRKELPASVAHACTVFVAIILRQVKEQRGGVKSEKIGEYSVTFASDEERLDYQMAVEAVKALRPISF